MDKLQRFHLEHSVYYVDTIVNEDGELPSKVSIAYYALMLRLTPKQIMARYKKWVKAGKPQ